MPAVLTVLTIWAFDVIYFLPVADVCVYFESYTRKCKRKHRLDRSFNLQEIFKFENTYFDCVKLTASPAIGSVAGAVNDWLLFPASVSSDEPIISRLVGGARAPDHG